jgi:hypothetical protein
LQLSSPTDTIAILCAVAGSSLLVAGVVVYMGVRIEKAVSARGDVAVAAEALASAPPATPAAVLPRAAGLAGSSPVSAATFATQWEGRYAPIAAEKCWKPHFTRYLDLPGHLDLEIRVAASGTVERIELRGFRNPDDSPDPELARRVFDCVEGLLRPVRFPSQPSGYTIQGRVNRPNPPPGFGAGPANSRREPVDPPERPP